MLESGSWASKGAPMSTVQRDLDTDAMRPMMRSPISGT